jgi:hypothetical protein
MAKAEFALRTLAKSALLWLTAALLFGSVFGALLSARPDGPSLSISQSAPEPAEDSVLAMGESKIAK